MDWIAPLRPRPQTEAQMEKQIFPESERKWVKSPISHKSKEDVSAQLFHPEQDKENSMGSLQSHFIIQHTRKEHT